MGIDTKLYLNSKYEIRDIVKVLETRFDLVDQTVKATDYRPEHKAKVRVEAALPSTPEFYHIFFQREGHDVRMVSLFLHHQTPIGNCIYLSLSHNEEAILIFRTLAEVLGGMLIENDCNGTIEEIDGMLNDEDDFIKVKCWVND